MTDFHPRILVIARRQAHRHWEAIISSPPDTLDPNRVVACFTPLYGSRFDLILVDLPHEDRTNGFHEWLNQDVMCRLSPNGRLVMWAT